MLAVPPPRPTPCMGRPPVNAAPWDLRHNSLISALRHDPRQAWHLLVPSRASSFFWVGGFNKLLAREI